MSQMLLKFTFILIISLFQTSISSYAQSNKTIEVKTYEMSKGTVSNRETKPINVIISYNLQDKEITIMNMKNEVIEWFTILRPNMELASPQDNLFAFYCKDSKQMFCSATIQLFAKDGKKTAMSSFGYTQNSELYIYVYSSNVIN